MNNDTLKAVHNVRNKIQKKYFTDKTVISMHDKQNVHADRKVGDVWEDEDGKQWTINEHGTRVSVTKIGYVGRMPMFCPDCKKIMRGRADERMWILQGKCHVCIAIMETKLKATGEYEEYEKKKVQANVDAWVKDMEQMLVEWQAEASKEKHQVIMNSYGEMETWYKGNATDKGLEKLEETLIKVKEKVGEQNEV